MITLSELIKRGSEANKLDFVIAIDPGSGSSSPTGLTIVEVNTKSILLAKNLSTKWKAVPHRIRDISNQFELELTTFLDELPVVVSSVTVCIESFVMRGKGGETLQRLIGSFLGRVPYNVHIEHVSNTVVKMIVGGHGHADKDQVADGVMRHFCANETSKNLILKLTADEQFDILDSLAIGVAGWKQLKK